MSLRTRCISGAAILIAALLPFPAANAQLGDLIKQKDVSGMSGGLGNAAGLSGALSGQSVTSGSLGNVAGLLEFCIKNKYLGGNKAASVKDSLMRKLPGGIILIRQWLQQRHQGHSEQQRRQPARPERRRHKETGDEADLRHGS